MYNTNVMSVVYLFMKQISQDQMQNQKRSIKSVRIRKKQDVRIKKLFLLHKFIFSEPMKYSSTDKHLS
jgi:hypothetical protein